MKHQENNMAPRINDPQKLIVHSIDVRISSFLYNLSVMFRLNYICIYMYMS